MIIKGVYVKSTNRTSSIRTHYVGNDILTKTSIYTNNRRYYLVEPKLKKNEINKLKNKKARW